MVLEWAVEASEAALPLSRASNDQSKRDPARWKGSFGFGCIGRDHVGAMLGKSGYEVALLNVIRGMNSCSWPCEEEDFIPSKLTGDMDVKCLEDVRMEMEHLLGIAKERDMESLWALRWRKLPICFLWPGNWVLLFPGYPVRRNTN